VLYDELIRPLLFHLDAEEAHVRVLALLARTRPLASILQGLGSQDDPRLHSRAFGLDFRNPVGLAAGLDKHGEAAHAWPWLGLGFAEIGTVTPRPQPGNPRPRLFRLLEDEAIINRMGFNSLGADAVLRNLRGAGRVGIPLGVNVGRNKDTPNEQAVDDYLAAIETLREVADYAVVNLSSPNTPELRALQQPVHVRTLVEQAVRAALCPGGRRVPVLVKVAPDFAPGELEASVDAALEGGAAGIVASNTTTARPRDLRSRHAIEIGGLSGRPLRDLATLVISRVYARTGGRVPIIGVGGIASAEDAYAKVRAGADLVQVYTGLVYQGPGLIARICQGLAELAGRDGCRSIADAVGQGA
jgi:dihydroorotate dehydrogenase